MLGTDLVHMTPARGYGVELGGVAIIALASAYGLPVSTTQVIVSRGGLPVPCGSEGGQGLLSRERGLGSSSPVQKKAWALPSLPPYMSAARASHTLATLPHTGLEALLPPIPPHRREGRSAWASWTTGA